MRRALARATIAGSVIRENSITAVESSVSTARSRSATDCQPAIPIAAMPSIQSGSRKVPGTKLPWISAGR